MTRYALIATLIAAAMPPAWAADTQEDLLRFTNGDQLHGSFLGLRDGPAVAWKRDDLDQAVEFKTSKVRHVVLRGGRPLKALESLSHAGLVNGDRVPGTIVGIDGGHVTLETSHAGTLRIPRNQISILAPNPLGGRVYYHGPFTTADWKMIHAAFPDGLPDEKPAPAGAAAPGNDAPDGEREPDEDPPQNAGEKATPAELPGRWDFSGAAWYWQQKRPGTALIRESGMPDRSVLRFDLAWKNRLSVAVAFHADFARPKPVDEEAGEDPEVDKEQLRAREIERILNGNPNDSSNLPRLFGNAYVLQIYTNYLMLFRTTLDTEGRPNVRRVHLNNNNLRLGDANKATIELRSNLSAGTITLFINEEFISQWNDTDFAGQDDPAAENPWTGGPGFGFVAQADDSPVRISDIVVSEWNGMPDSARSLQIDDLDVVLMANGTDRYAGRVGSLDEQGKLVFEGKHGTFRFPVDDIAEIRFARKQLAAAPEDSAERVLVRFSPVGSISGRPAGSAGGLLQLIHPLIGELDLSIDSAVMLEFNSSNQFIDDWDANF
jgi:hypothetical protein